MSKLVKKELEGEDLLERTRERVDYIYENYEAVFVANSGGKDSGSVFNVVMDGWERNKGKMEHPIISIFHDGESTPFPETVDVMKEYAERWPDEHYTYWCAMPSKVSLMTHPEERQHNIWWNEEHVEDWVRPLPTWVDDYENMELVRPDHPYVAEKTTVDDDYVDTAHHLIEGYCEEHDIDRDDAINLVGLRTEESMNRYTTIINMEGWLSEDRDDAPCHIGYPVYDWGTADLWKLHEQEDWPYNEFYDKMHQIGVASTKARNGTPFGAHPIRAKSPKQQRNWWPERYVRWERRHPGTVLAFDFGYDLFNQEFAKPDDLTWEEFTAKVLNSFDESERDDRVELVENRLEKHWNHSDSPLQQSEDCPQCGMSWETMSRDLIEWLRDYREDDH